MSQADGKKEIIYQMTMSAAKGMLEKGLISKEQYAAFESEMIEKYHPILGTLFSNKDLQ